LHLGSGIKLSFSAILQVPRAILPTHRYSAMSYLRFKCDYLDIFNNVFYISYILLIFPFLHTLNLYCILTVYTTVYCILYFNCITTVYCIHFNQYVAMSVTVFTVSCLFLLFLFYITIFYSNLSTFPAPSLFLLSCPLFIPSAYALYITLFLFLCS
jgi:hypothetical protein